MFICILFLPFSWDSVFGARAFPGCLGILAIYTKDSTIGRSVHELCGWWTSLQWLRTSHLWGILECKYGQALFSLLLGFPEWGRAGKVCLFSLSTLSFNTLEYSIVSFSWVCVPKARTCLSHCLQTVNWVLPVRWDWGGHQFFVALSLLSFSLVSVLTCLSHPSVEKTPGPSHSSGR